MSLFASMGRDTSAIAPMRTILTKPHHEVGVHDTELDRSDLLDLRTWYGKSMSMPAKYASKWRRPGVASRDSGYQWQSRVVDAGGGGWGKGAACLSIAVTKPLHGRRYAGVPH